MVRTIIVASAQREETLSNRSADMTITVQLREKEVRPTWKSMARITSLKWARRAVMPPKRDKTPISTAVLVKWVERPDVAKNPEGCVMPAMPAFIGCGHYPCC